MEQIVKYEPVRTMEQMTDYHKDYEYYSKSFLMQFEKSPLAAFTYMNTERVPTDAIIFGQAYHAVIDGTFKDSFVSDKEIFDTIGGKSPRSTNAYKEWVAEQTKQIIQFPDIEILKQMILQLKENEVVKRINAFELVQEMPFYAEISGYKVKCKPDGLQIGRGKNGENLVIDWKTTDDLSEYSIKRSIFKYGYDVQAALYCEIIAKLNNDVETNMLFIFQDKNAPYDVLPVLVKWDSEIMQFGRDKWRTYAQKADECFKSGIWPGVASKYSENLLIL